MAALRRRLAPRAEETAPLEAALLRSDRFRLAHEGEWLRLEAIVARAEAGRLGRLSDADLVDFPALYRSATASLSIARETMLDTATVAWLEGLVQRAWAVAYGPRVGLWRWLGRFLGGGWARAVRAIAPEIAVALAVMVAGGLAGWWLTASDPQWYAALVGEMAGDRMPGASRALLRSTLYGNAGESGLAVFAAALVSHNVQIALLCFALGFLVGLPTLALLVQNSGSVGAMLWLFHGQGLTLDLVGWLAIHGTTELSAILLAGAAGLHIGRAMAFPGQRSVLAAMAEAGRRAALVMLGVALMLVVAGLLEGFARQLVEPVAARLAIAGAMLVLWWGYFALAGRGKAGSSV